MFMLQHRKPEKYGAARKGNVPADERERAEAIRARDLATYDEKLERLSKLYGGLVKMEREKRLEGDIVAADFYLRQLTHMEVLLELGGGGKYLLWWANGGNGSGEDPHNSGVEITATAITEELDALRRQAWEAAAEPPRPNLPEGRTLACGYLEGGPDAKQREARVKAARAKAAEAQWMWEEASREIVEATRSNASEAAWAS
jgi:hypothetical protein